MIRFVEVPLPTDPYDTSVITEVDTHYCAMGEHCAHVAPGAPLGQHLWEDEDAYGRILAGVCWNYPFVPEGTDPADTSAWVCEDCACWIEDMHALRELFVGLP